MCVAGRRDKSCGIWWGRRRPNPKDGPFFIATVTTARGYLHWYHGPAHFAASDLNRVICVVRPRGQGWPTGETVYDMQSIYRPEFDDPGSDVSQATRDRALTIVLALRQHGRVA